MTRPVASRTCRTPMPRSTTGSFELRSTRGARTSTNAGACAVTVEDHHLNGRLAPANAQWTSTLFTNKKTTAHVDNTDRNPPIAMTQFRAGRQQDQISLANGARQQNWASFGNGTRKQLPYPTDRVIVLDKSSGRCAACGAALRPQDVDLFRMLAWAAGRSVLPRRCSRSVPRGKYLHSQRPRALRKRQTRYDIAHILDANL